MNFRRGFHRLFLVATICWYAAWWCVLFPLWRSHFGRVAEQKQNLATCRATIPREPPPDMSAAVLPKLPRGYEDYRPMLPLPPGATLVGQPAVPPPVARPPKSLAQVLQDPDFQGLPLEERRKVLIAIDRRFAELSTEEQNKILGQNSEIPLAPWLQSQQPPAPKNVQMPDGAVISFPGAMPDDQIYRECVKYVLQNCDKSWPPVDGTDEWEVSAGAAVLPWLAYGAGLVLAWVARGFRAETPRRA
jgi:hypothetical protein